MINFYFITSNIADVYRKITLIPHLFQSTNSITSPLFPNVQILNGPCLGNHFAPKSTVSYAFMNHAFGVSRYILGFTAGGGGGGGEGGEGGRVGGWIRVEWAGDALEQTNRVYPNIGRDIYGIYA